MAWEYLLKETERAKIIAEWLSKNNFIKEKIIYDLDCGVASLVKQISGFSAYYGNDISEEYISIDRQYNIPNTYFEIKDNKEINPERIDVLIAMGQFLPCEIMEFIRIIKKNKPIAVVFEGAYYYEKVMGSFTLIKCFMETEGYILDVEVDIQIESRYRNVRDRRILCFKKI